MAKKKSKEKSHGYPHLYIKELLFNDNSNLSLNERSIVVFVGANNCGKSQILKDIENAVSYPESDDFIVLRKAKIKTKGCFDNPVFLSRCFKKQENGNVISFSSDISYDLESLVEEWNKKDMCSIIPSLFMKRISTEDRLSISNACSRESDKIPEPFYVLHDNNMIMNEISDLFYLAFGEELILNKSNISNLSLHIGKIPDKSQYSLDNIDDFWEKVSCLPRLQDQGDGMRSFASLIIDAFTSDYSITLIDEPEAFLHPPQSRLLGKMLVDNNRNKRQLFISTHSEDFLQGILDANCENVTIVRIDRHETINRINILSRKSINEFWDNPILRYTNILNGIFHEKVIVCESDYDCLFYHAIVDSICQESSINPPDILFTHCGGKDRMKDIVKALKSVGVQVAVICDFDIILDSRSFKKLAESFGIDWDNALSLYMKTVYDMINSAKNKDIKNNLKKMGKIALSGEAPSSYEAVEKICSEAGLFIVPVGEMEGFDRTVNKEKKEWVYTLLKQYDLLKEPKLNDAKCFVKEVIDWKQNDIEKTEVEIRKTGKKKKREVAG